MDNEFKLEKRDYIAAMTMHALIIAGQFNCKEIIERAVVYTDALLYELRETDRQMKNRINLKRKDVQNET